MEREAFVMKPKHQCHLSQWGEWLYGAQSWKERRLLICVCLNWQSNFNSKKWWKEKLFLWNQGINVIYPNEHNEFMVANQEKKKWLLCDSVFVLIDRRTLILKHSENKSVLNETKASMLFIPT